MTCDELDALKRRIAESGNPATAITNAELSAGRLHIKKCERCSRLGLARIQALSKIVGTERTTEIINKAEERLEQAEKDPEYDPDARMT